MDTMKTKILRHHLKIDDFPMSGNDLIKKLEEVRKIAYKTEPEHFMVGLPSPFTVNEGSLVLQWDEVVKDSEDDDE